jgi:microcystin-dependent protein
MEAYIGQIVLFAGNYAPQGWMLCNGQVLNVNQNQALFAVIGNVYGGDGRSTFALPNLCGRVPLGAGQGVGLTARAFGQGGGTETVVLTAAQAPAHTHTASAKVNATSDAGDAATPQGAVWAQAASAGEMPYKQGTPNAEMQAGAVQVTVDPVPGGDQAHPNMQPYLALNYIICVEGLFPSRW